MKIHELTAVELLEKLRSKELSSVEAVEALHQRADATNSKVNALIHRFREEALEQAREADAARAHQNSVGPLLGLPVTIKENIATSGLDVTLGIRSRRGNPEPDDAVVVKLLRRAGAIILGKTNLSQALLFHESDNPIWGATNNPWNAKRAPGGSSGGEAAAIAAGMSPCGIGTDIGGSIRVPAAWCGIAGLKPTVHRWSNVGCYGAMMGQETIRSQCGPMARTSRDVSFLFRVLDSHTHSVLDPAVAPMSTPDPSRIESRSLRIGFYDDDGFLTPSAAVRRAVRQATAAAEALGATLVPFPPPRAVEIVYLYFAVLSSDGGITLDRVLQGDPVVEQLKSLRFIAKAPTVLRQVLAAFVASQGEQRLERLLETVHKKPVADYWALTSRITQLRHDVLAAWDRAGIDALICPAHATVAIHHGQSKNFSLGGCYSMRYNLLNFPAGIVPVTRVGEQETQRGQPADRLDREAASVDIGSAGLPVGVQVVARPYREDVVLATMVALEAVLRDNADFPRTPIGG